MAETGSRQFDISKVVFLAILLLAIFAAWEFSTGRTALKMEPVEAISGELAISLPSGDNWRDDGGGQWIYHQQSFVQRRVYGEQACTVEVRYYLSPITGDAASYLPAAGGGRNLERIGQGELSSGGINWAWAAYGSGRGQAQLYYAVARLGDYRMVTVSVHGRGGTWLLAEMVFEAIINSAKYHDTGLLTEGAGLVASVQEEGVEAIRNAFSADVFVINDEVGAAVGFYISRIPMVSETGETVVDGMLYQTNPRALLSRTRFVTFDIVNFEWHTWHPGHPGSGAIVEAQDGVLSEVRGGLRRRGQAVSRAAIADAVTELVGWQLVSRGIPEAVVDVISHDRTVTPMQVRPGPAAEEGDAWRYSAVFTSLAEPERYAEIFYDANGTVIRKVVHSRQTLVFERSTQSEIMRLFPELAGEIAHFRRDIEIPAEEIDHGVQAI